MARGDFRIIGATTPMEWSAYVSGDTAFVRVEMNNGRGTKCRRYD